MWLIGLLFVALSAFLFANAQWITSKLQNSPNGPLISKALALLCLGAGTYFNNQAWAVESGLSLTVASFSFCMFSAVYFKLPLSTQALTKRNKEAA